MIDCKAFVSIPNCLDLEGQKMPIIVTHQFAVSAEKLTTFLLPVQKSDLELWSPPT